MIRTAFALLIIALMPVFWSGAFTAQAQQPPADPPRADNGNDAADNGEQEITISFSTEVPLEQFILMVAKQMHKIFIYEPAKIKPLKVFILADRLKIKPSALYSLLLALLEHMQYTITYYGETTDNSVEIYKIEPITNAVTQLGPLRDYNEGELVERAEMVTMLVHLEYADPVSVQRALRSLISSRNFNVQPISSTGVNAILISGFEYQIKRISKLLTMMDKAGPQLDLAVIPVMNAEADTLSTTVDNMLRQRLAVMARSSTASSAVENMITLQADTRTNSIIVQATKENIKLVQKLIRQLDLEVAEEVTGRIHIYYCKHSDAASLASALEGIIQSIQNNTTRRNPTTGQIVNQSQQDNSSQEIVIVADETTNSLIITAIPEDYLEIKQVIEKLDIRKPQVMIEAAIIEVNADHNLEFGFELTTLDQPADGETRLFAGTSFGYSDIVDENGVPVSDSGETPAGRLPTYGGEGTILGLWNNDYFSIPILMKAIETTTHANVLSRPKLLTNDNEAAELTIEDQEPTVTSTITGSSDSSSFGGYEEAGITFKITPHISEEDYLRLEVELSVESFTTRSATTPAEAAPPKTSRKIKATITIPNRQMIIIGGLTSTTASKVTKKVPILGDIPFIGELFKSRQTQEKRTNLYIFIRPVILRDPNFEDLHKLSTEIIREVEQEMIDTVATRKFLELAKEDRAKYELDSIGKTSKRRRYLSVRKSLETAKNEREEKKEKDSKFSEDN